MIFCLSFFYIFHKNVLFNELRVLPGDGTLLIRDASFLSSVSNFNLYSRCLRYCSIAIFNSARFLIVPILILINQNEIWLSSMFYFSTKWYLKVNITHETFLKMQPLLPTPQFCQKRKDWRVGGGGLHFKPSRSNVHHQSNLVES